MQTPSETVAPRTVGRYTLYHEIASGGMATVHVGRLNGPEGFARTVAIKRLHAHLAKDPEFVAMLLDEARVAARVRHPNVVQTLDVVATDGEVFLVMEYVTGESFARLLRRARADHPQVPPRIAAAVVVALLHGLHAAHEAIGDRGEPLGIVHRDVSPQNVIVGLDGVSRVLDFGIAKAAGRLQVTREGELKGKLAYMAPEQLSGGAMTRRCDIYAAGIVFWEALVGDYLFRAETEAATLAKVADARVVPPSQRVRDLDPALDRITLRALSKEPSLRYPSAKEMALDIERSVSVATASEVSEWVNGLVGGELRDQTNLISQIDATTPASGTRTSENDAQPAPKRWLRVAAAAAAALVAGTLTLVSIARTPALERSSAISPTEATPPATAYGDPAMKLDDVPSSVPDPELRPVATSVEPPSRPSLPNKRSDAGTTHSLHGTPGAKPRTSCDPPYVTDEKGHHHYKDECL